MRGDKLKMSKSNDHSETGLSVKGSELSSPTVNGPLQAMSIAYVNSVPKCPHCSGLLSSVFVRVNEALAVMRIGRTKFYDEVGCGRIHLKHCGRRALVSWRTIVDWANSLPIYDPNK